jgi:exodeoxyribonuclease III
VRVVNVYVVNGREVGTPEYALKLRWLDAFATWLRSTYQTARPLLILGDITITPERADRGALHCRHRRPRRTQAHRGRG